MLSAKQRKQTVVLFAAGRASVQMSSHTGHVLVGTAALQLQLNVFVKQFEALVTTQLGALRTEQVS